MKTYYIYVDGKQEGPFNIEELQEKKIYLDTPVWCEDFEDWKKAKEIEELQRIIIKTPPPFKNDDKNYKKIPLPKVNLKPAIQQTKVIGKKAGNIAFKLILSIIIVIVAFTILAFVLKTCNSTLPEDNSNKLITTSVLDKERDYPLSYIGVTSLNTDVNFWGNKIDINYTITNNATVVSYKNVILRVEFSDKNGNMITAEEYPLSETFAPNSANSLNIKVKRPSDTEKVKLSISKASPTY